MLIFAYISGVLVTKTFIIIKSAGLFSWLNSSLVCNNAQNVNSFY